MAMSRMAKSAIISDLIARFPEALEVSPDQVLAAWLAYEQSDEYGNGDGDAKFPLWLDIPA